MDPVVKVQTTYEVWRVSESGVPAGKMEHDDILTLEEAHAVLGVVRGPWRMNACILKVVRASAETYERLPL